jgi:hypothetical protein
MVNQRQDEKLLNRTFQSKGKDYYLLDFIRVITWMTPSWAAVVGTNPASPTIFSVKWPGLR